MGAYSEEVVRAAQILGCFLASAGDLAQTELEMLS